MITPDYYTEVCCYFQDSRHRIDAWLDTITDIGDGLAPGNMFDVDFSATKGRELQDLTVHAAHAMPPRREAATAETWLVLNIAQTHALTLFRFVGALEHISHMSVQVTQGVGREEVTLLRSAVQMP